MNEEVKQALRELEDKFGHLDPQKVVDAARSKSSPLHRLFEWNDSLAANLHRLEVARRLIGRVRVEVTTSESDTRPIRAYIENPEKDEDENASSYISIDAVKREGDLIIAAIQKPSAHVLGSLRNWIGQADYLGADTSQLDEAVRLIEQFTSTLENDPNKILKRKKKAA